MPRIFRRLALLAPLIGLLSAPIAGAFETRATGAWVIDQTTGTVLLSKNAETPLPPASMSKLMTLYMLFEALRDGRVTMDTTWTVSTRAREMRGSTMFLNELDRPTTLELIRGIIINSGNDACVVVAEGLAGSEEAFARQMTERARGLGMTQTILANSSGWPHPEHRMSMRDLGVLTVRLVEDFPDLFPYFAETEFDYKDRSPANRFNRNPLFRVFPPTSSDPNEIRTEGLKTGHTSEAGYGFVGAARLGDRRVIFVVNGLESERDRLEESQQIVNWAFRQFVQRTVARPGAQLATAPVWMGESATVGLVAAEDTVVLVPAISQDGLEARVEYQGPIEAPIAQGQQLAELVITHPDMETRRLPLVAATDVPQGGFLVRLRTTAEVLLNRTLEAGLGAAGS